MILLLASLISICCHADSTHAEDPAITDCVVHDWTYMTCTFNVPGSDNRDGRWTIVYSRCYGCDGRTTYSGPNPTPNSCTWTQSSGKDSYDATAKGITYTLFMYDNHNGSSLMSSRKDINPEHIVKPGKVLNLKYEFVNNTSVVVSWNSKKKKLKFKLTLTSNVFNDTRISYTDKKFVVYELSTFNGEYVLSVESIPINRLKEVGFWSDPATIVFGTKTSDFILVESMSYQVISSERKVHIYWEQRSSLVAPKKGSIFVLSAGSMNWLLKESHNIAANKTYFETSLNLTANELYKFQLSAWLDDFSIASAEMIISHDDGTDSKMSDKLFIITNEREYILLHWPPRVDNVSRFDIYFQNSAALAEEGQEKKMFLLETFNSEVFKSNLSFEKNKNRDFFISAQTMIRIENTSFTVSGPLFPFQCYYSSKRDLEPPTKFLSVKNSESGSFTVMLEDRNSTCGGFHVSHYVLEYYLDTCESYPCSEKSTNYKAIINTGISTWSTSGLPMGRYKIRIKSVCDLTKRESKFTDYIIADVMEKNYTILLVGILVAIAVSLAVGIFISSKLSSNIRNKIFIEVPKNSENAKVTNNNTFSYSVQSLSSAMQLFRGKLQRVKSYYRELVSRNGFIYDLDDDVHADDQKEDRSYFAWWNPGYSRFPKYYKESHVTYEPPAPSTRHYFSNMDLCSWNKKYTNLNRYTEDPLNLVKNSRKQSLSTSALKADL